MILGIWVWAERRHPRVSYLAATCGLVAFVTELPIAVRVLAAVVLLVNIAVWLEDLDEDA